MAAERVPEPVTGDHGSDCTLSFITQVYQFHVQIEEQQNPCAVAHQQHHYPSHY